MDKWYLLVLLIESKDLALPIFARPELRNQITRSGITEIRPSMHTILVLPFVQVIHNNDSIRFAV
jgi:hypothetical protein